jgi:tetratricopeptide (TPR) repeat protein
MSLLGVSYMKKLCLLVVIFLLPLQSFATDLEPAGLDPAIVQLQHEWATANYHTPKSAAEIAFKTLTEKAAEITEKSGHKADALIWQAIVLSGYAKAAGGLSALKSVGRSKDLLLESIKLDPLALNGSAYTSLGSLYYKVPMWPISFGDKDKAREYLEKALAINPNGIDPNYFYADYLYETGQYANAIKYFEKALQAPPRAGREDADEGRKKDINAGLVKARDKLS